MKTPVRKLKNVNCIGRVGARRQKGVVLIVALVVLLAMTLAGALMLRTVGAGVAVAGNLSIKQTSLAASDVGVESARAWISDPTHLAVNYENDDATAGYFATWNGNIAAPAVFDPVRFNGWVNVTSPVTATYATNGVIVMKTDDVTGNTTQYVIHRLCSATGPFNNSAAQHCVLPLANVNPGGSASVCVGACTPIDSNTKRPYYRVTTRTSGPRNTLTYVQVVMF